MAFKPSSLGEEVEVGVMVQSLPLPLLRSWAAR